MTALDEAQVPTQPPVLRPRQRNIAFAVIAGGMLLAALDGTIVSTALPTIVGDLGGAEHMTWVVTAYMLTQTIATVLAGKFGDIYGRKRLFIGSIILFIVASALCGMSEGMTWLIVMRGLQGIGGGGLTVTATAMIADIIPCGSEASTKAGSAPSSGWPPSSDPSSVACSPTICPGAGCSTSTCRWR